jgi:hypothetical protein
VSKESKKMVVDADILLGDIPKLLGRTVVRSFCGKVFFSNSLSKWIDEN